MRKRIKLQGGKESQKGYLDDIQPTEQAAKPVQVRKSFLIDKSIEDKIQDYIYKKRTQGEIYYSQTALFHEAMESFFKKHK